MKTRLATLFLFGFILLLCACKPSQKTVRTVANINANKPPIAFPDQRKLDITYTNGVIQKMQGNFPEAIDYFKKCLGICPNHSAFMYEIAYINNTNSKSSEAIPYAEKAVLLEGSNEWYRLLLAKSYMEVGKFTNASETFEQLIKLRPEKIDYYFLWSSALLHAGKLIKREVYALFL